MALRLPVEITISSPLSANAKVSALANSGYETDKREIVIPLSFARVNLGLILKHSKKVNYQAAGGQKVEFILYGNAKIRVVTEDKKSSYVDATVFISKNEDQVILNDKLVDALGIVLVKFAKGLWRFGDDPHDRLRDPSHKQFF